MLKSRIYVFLNTFVLVVANPFPSGTNRWVSARQDVDEQNLDNSTPFAQKFPEDPSIMVDPGAVSLKSPVVDDLVSAVNDSDPDSLDQQDPILLAGSDGIDDCATGDSNSDGDAHIRKRSLSLSPRDRAVCPTTRKLIFPGFPISNFHPKRKPVKFKLKKPNSNPCGEPRSSEFENELIYVSCGYVMVGQLRSNPDFVLNCMPGKLPYRVIALAL